MAHVQIYKADDNITYTPKFMLLVAEDDTNGSHVLESPQYAAVIKAQLAAEQYAKEAEETAKQLSDTVDEAIQPVREAVETAQETADNATDKAQEALDTRVPNRADGTTKGVCYTINASGDNTVSTYAVTNSPKTIAIRDDNGRLKTSYPEGDVDAANKKYIDDKETALNERIASTKADLELIIGDNYSDTNAYISEVERIAKGATQAVSFVSYSKMIDTLNSHDSADKRTYRTGQNFYIRTPNVPDLWVYHISPPYGSYTYVSDEAFTTELKDKGYVKVGYYLLAPLETQKVDLTEYPKKEEVALDIQTAKDDIVRYVNDEYYKAYVVDQSIATAKQEAIDAILTLYPNLDEEVF
jgi:hypothetical protein